MTGFDCRLIFSGVVSIVALSFAHPALADCSTPAGVEADQIYNTTYDVMQFCNGADWVNMGAAGGGASESDPQVGAVTNNKWCRADGTKIECDQDTPSGGGGGDIQTFNASGTWTKPGSGSMAMIECIGGGAGGSRHGTMGVGGGGGGYNMRLIPLVSLDETEAVTVGAGGAGRTGSNGGGAEGSSSSFGAHLTAYGGGVGGANIGSGGGYMNNDGGPRILISSLEGVQAWQGDPTQWGYWHGGGGSTTGTAGYSIYGGGGGGGHNSGVVIPGGASTYGGAGGNGAANNVAGGNGTQPGGGGAGARNANGGNGAAGRCKITVF